MRDSESSVDSIRFNGVDAERIGANTIIGRTVAEMHLDVTILFSDRWIHGNVTVLSPL